VLPDNIHNEAIGVSNGRSQITLDPALASACPLETLAVYTSASIECATTQDWGLDGAMQRPVSSSTTYFVREVGVSVTEDLEWLHTNIFGVSDPGVVEAF